MRAELPPCQPDGLATLGPSKFPCHARVGCADGIRIVTDPLRSASCDSSPRFLTLPRGMPNPAELFGIWSRLGDFPNCVGVGPWFTGMILCPGSPGVRGPKKVGGGFTTTGIVFHPIQAPPGCQAHPYIGMYTQDP